VVGVMYGVAGIGIEVPLGLTYSISNSPIIRTLTLPLVSSGSITQYYSFSPIQLNVSHSLSFTISLDSNPADYVCFFNNQTASQTIFYNDANISSSISSIAFSSTLILFCASTSQGSTLPLSGEASAEFDPGLSASFVAALLVPGSPANLEFISQLTVAISSSLGIPNSNAFVSISYSSNGSPQVSIIFPPSRDQSQAVCSFAGNLNLTLTVLNTTFGFLLIRVNLALPFRSSVSLEEAFPVALTLIPGLIILGMAFFQV
jgi:hypothetical protein